jgi:ankyrin repeat protein
MKSNHYLKEALNCKNTKLLNPLNLIKDEISGEIRARELTSLHVASIMGNLITVKELLSQAKELLTPEQYKLFVNVKVARELGGNNALLYACNSRNSNFILVDFLINKAGADPNTMNDYAVNCLLIATKKSQLNILDLLLKTGVDIGFVDRNGCNALHIASAAGYVDIVEMILLYWSKQKMHEHREK